MIEQRLAEILSHLDHGDEINFEKSDKGSLELIDDEYNNNQMMQQQRMPR